MTASPCMVLTHWLSLWSLIRVSNSSSRLSTAAHTSLLLFMSTCLIVEKMNTHGKRRDWRNVHLESWDRELHTSAESFPRSLAGLEERDLGVWLELPLHTYWDHQGQKHWPAYPALQQWLQSWEQRTGSLPRFASFHTTKNMLLCTIYHHFTTWDWRANVWQDYQRITVWRVSWPKKLQFYHHLLTLIAFQTYNSNPQVFC